LRYYIKRETEQKVYYQKNRLGWRNKKRGERSWTRAEESIGVTFAVFRKI
jgi:hypothetical protein